MDGRAGKLWGISAAVAVVSLVILIWLAGYGWFQAFLLSLLILFLVALVLWILWDSEPGEPVPGIAAAVPRPIPGAQPSRAEIIATAIPSGETAGPPPQPEGTTAAHAIPMGATEGPAPNPPRPGGPRRRALGGAEAVPLEDGAEDDGVEPLDELIGEDRGIPEEVYDEFSGIEEVEEAHDDSGEPLRNTFNEAADRVPEMPDRVLPPKASGRKAPARAKAPKRADPRTAPRKAAGKNGGKAGAAAGRREAAPPDDLTRIRGIGPKVAQALERLGITRFAQLAALTAEEAARIDADPAIRGRLSREGWIEQAGALAAGPPEGKD